MKNTFKRFWAFAALAIAVGTIVTVACTKDHEDSTILQHQQISKKADLLEQIRSGMVSYFNACDLAYQNDSSAFLRACYEGDYEDFLLLTGIKDSLGCSLWVAIQQEFEVLVSENEDLLNEEGQCAECEGEALAHIGRLASATGGAMAALAPEDVDSSYRAQLGKCLAICNKYYDPDKKTLCIYACYGVKEQLQSYTTKILSYVAEFNVACNIAYEKDSVALLAACEKGETMSLMSMTGTSQQFINEFQSAAMKGLRFLNDLQTDDDEPTGEPCSECQEDALLPLARQLVGTHGHLPARFDDYFCPTNNWQCIKHCFGQAGGDMLQSISCLAACQNYLYWKAEGLVADYVDNWWGF